MKEFMLGLASILLTVLLTGCASTGKDAIAISIPDLPSDEAMLEELIEEPETTKDILHNSIVFEYLYANAKMQVYILQKHIADCIGDKGASKEYEERIRTIQEAYAL